MLKKLISLSQTNTTNNFEAKKSDHHLIQEMFDVIGIIEQLLVGNLDSILGSLDETNSLFLGGEGSSRIFPAKNAIHEAKRLGLDLRIQTEGSLQALEYYLDASTVIGISNSGRTSEVIELFSGIQGKHKYALTANRNSMLGDMSSTEFVLNCGQEQAVAATKSVMEQALFVRAIINQYHNQGDWTSSLQSMADALKNIFTSEINQGIVDVLVNAEKVYFVGKNDGVAEEASLKTIEILRKEAAWLEGTILLHGIEEVMKSNQVLVWIEPFEKEESKVYSFLFKAIGIDVIAISHRDTMFPTLKIPNLESNLQGYLELAMSWKLLVEAGLKANIDLDKPARARKVGNAVGR
jgi:glutamine---fructose-6-phosphate transaminase (isomerizing)